MITVTDALIIRLAKLSDAERNLVLSEHPDSNFSLMKKKCEDLAEKMEQEKKYDLAEKIDNLKFIVNVHLIKQTHGSDSVELEIYERQSS
jgi:hypothetical protein